MKRSVHTYVTEKDSGLILTLAFVLPNEEMKKSPIFRKLGLLPEAERKLGNAVKATKDIIEGHPSVTEVQESNKISVNKAGGSQIIHIRLKDGVELEAAKESIEALLNGTDNEPGVLGQAIDNSFSSGPK